MQTHGVIGKTRAMTTLAAWTLMLEGAKLNVTDALVRLGLLLAAYIIFTLAQRFLARQHLIGASGHWPVSEGIKAE